MNDVNKDNSVYFYNKLKKQIFSQRKDLMINYDELNLLNYEQRREIEIGLLSLCNSGYIDALECIPFIKLLNIEYLIQLDAKLESNIRFKAKYLKVMFLKSAP